MGEGGCVKSVHVGGWVKECRCVKGYRWVGEGV